MYRESRINVYENFDSVVLNKKYSLISIDGPWGSDGISRIDILPHIPYCIEKDFVILLDDYNRGSEKKMINKLIEKFTNSGIEVLQGTYEGEKTMCIVVPKHLGFLLTL